MNLLIDLGNTRLKWAQHDAGVWLAGAVVHRERDLAAVLSESWKSLPRPARILMTAVAAPAVQATLERWLLDRWQLRAEQLRSPPEQLGVRNGYRDPATLGADRWAALLGARALGNGACIVVACGTAVTIDTLRADGGFAGGVIFPGLQLLRQALATGTAGIGANVGNALTSLAQTTADGVAAGTLFGLVGAIERCLQEQERALGASATVFITGGDAPVLIPHLSRAVTEMPDLVLKGLARVVESGAVVA
jgi:type III pantothenate kinase